MRAAEPPSDAGAAAAKPRFSLADLYLHDAVVDLAVSPAGREAVYVREWADRAWRKPHSALWRVVDDAARPGPLEISPADAHKPVYSPDGKWIAFQSARPLPDGSPACPPVPSWSDLATDIWLIPAAGGKAVPLAGKQKPYGRVFSDPFYARVAFSPDGKRLAFVADDGRPERTAAEVSRNITVLREDQGEGYEGFGPAQIWVADLADSAGGLSMSHVRRLTSDDFWYGDPQWSPDGKSLVVHANRTDDRESVRFSINKNFDLWTIDVDSGRIEQLTSGPGPEVSPRWSPDGSRLVCLSVPRKGPHQDVYNLLVIERGSNPIRSRVTFDQHAPTVADAPHLPPSFPLPQDVWLDNRRVMFDALDGLRTRRQIVDLDATDARSMTTTEEPADRAEKRALRQRLTPASQAWMKQRLVGSDKIVRWKSADGLEIDGVLTLPSEQVARPPCKLVVMPHGGPHSRASSGAGFLPQLFAAQGYAVFQPNFRGTSGYGRKFLDADRGDLGGGDMQDILTGIEQLVQDGLVDRRRQFVYGVSYGGFMTCWLVGHTQQFRAAAAQNAVTDMDAMWGTSDLQSWTQWELGGRPWEVPDAMHKHSPFAYAAQVKTPTLILHADHDRRCPLAMGRMFYRALQQAGVETEMVIYHDERHGIVELPHQEDLYRRVLDWFAAHDLADSAPGK